MGDMGKITWVEVVGVIIFLIAFAEVTLLMAMF